PAEVELQRQQMIDEAAATAPAETKPVAGKQAGIKPTQTLTPTTTSPGQTRPASQQTKKVGAGFSYFHPGESINLSNESDFISRLPNSGHFDDGRVKRQ